MTPLALAPPPIACDASLSWLLEAAFAEGYAGAPASDAAAALALARRFELSGRVSLRLSRLRQGRPLGELEPELIEDYHTNLAFEALLARCLGRTAELAARLSVPIIALKYAGLKATGVLEPGTRVVGDLDLLVPEQQLASFWRALLEAGFQRTGARGYAHQLEALVDPFGAVVELHRNIPGLFLGGRRFATANELIASRSLTVGENSLLVPGPPLLAAHALAHGLVQNFATPQSYSPLRMIADLIDLRRSQPDVLAQAATYLAPELAPTCRALESLCRALAAGGVNASGLEDANADLLLRHCVAARSDAAYAARLRASGFEQKFRDGSSLAEIFRYALRALFPSAPELDVIYGPAATVSGRIGRRLARPVELARRAARRWLSPGSS